MDVRTSSMSPAGDKRRTATDREFGSLHLRPQDRSRSLQKFGSGPGNLADPQCTCPAPKGIGSPPLILFGRMSTDLRSARLYPLSNARENRVVRGAIMPPFNAGTEISGGRFRIIEALEFRQDQRSRANEIPSRTLGLEHGSIPGVRPAFDRRACLPTRRHAVGRGRARKLTQNIASVVR